MNSYNLLLLIIPSFPEKRAKYKMSACMYLWYKIRILLCVLDLEWLLYTPTKQSNIKVVSNNGWICTYMRVLNSREISHTIIQLFKRCVTECGIRIHNVMILYSGIQIHDCNT